MEELELERKEGGSLRKLAIGGLPNLELLPQWILLGSTKTLQQLYIQDLQDLSTLPTWFQHLTSLQCLYIRNCLKLSSLPEEMQHLTALKKLNIAMCPKLSKRCTGEDWHKIAHVPEIYYDVFKTTTNDE
ncbi:putative disease resistance protein RGA4 [Gossypium arboreum]|uniref:putative disease resistance protein RGA4 n=1 Tax=Gossypium arboreum TaxID=29729 RepID=UPI0008193322|nr:putative disease resistance protein RGA4 [Gossypium arboreum]